MVYLVGIINIFSRLPMVWGSASSPTGLILFSHLSLKEQQHQKCPVVSTSGSCPRVRIQLHVFWPH